MNGDGTPAASRVLAAAATVAALLGLPLLGPQAWWLRRFTPRLPPAAGPAAGELCGHGPPIRVLVLGESTAAGVGAPTHRESLAGHLAVTLARATGQPINWRAVGRNGATARATLRDLCPALNRERTDLVVLALGVNDAVNWVSPERWARDLRALLDELDRRLDSPRVVVAGVPPLNRFPQIPAPLGTVLGWRSRALDGAARAMVAGRPRAVYAPFDMEGGQGRFASDGFHPSPAGYATWAEHLTSVGVAGPNGALGDAPPAPAALGEPAGERVA